MKYYLLLLPLLLFGMSYKYSNNNKNIFLKKKFSKMEKGCCFDVGFSRLMIPIYNNHRDIDKVECPIENRLGGSTQFLNLNCSKLKILQVNMPYNKKDF